jgi:hypothetical protein
VNINAQNQIPAAPPPVLNPKNIEPHCSTRILKPSQHLLKSLQGDPSRINTITVDLESNIISLVQSILEQPNSVQDTLLKAIAVNHNSDPNVPASYSQAMKDPGWRVAIEKEIQAHIRNQTWKIVDRLPHFKLLPIKWVFKKKHDGTKKARLVAKGFL